MSRPLRELRWVRGIGLSDSAAESVILEHIVPSD
jgi:hypothetical protein